MNQTDKKELYLKALSKWGLDLQMLMLMEECAELTQAVSKFIRAKKENKQNHIKNLVEEIADVEIMIEQIKYWGDFFDHKVNFIKNQKLNKLKKMLEQ